MTGRKPSAAEVQELGQALVNAIQSQNMARHWPIRLEMMELKSEIVGFGPDNVEVFRIRTAGQWL